MPTIALVGDFNPDVVAHQAIAKCLDLSRSSGPAVKGVWLGTELIVPGDDSRLKSFQGVWCIPASPYKNTDGALWAIQFARRHRVPFLGTCGGFQHALLEYARNVLALKNASHSELDPDTAFPLLHRMQCPLVEKSQRLTVTGGVQFPRLYEHHSKSEQFHCSYGLNPVFEHFFTNGPLQIVARSEDGEVRAVELRGHPFFMATLFQPEREALLSGLHPLVKGFFAACASASPRS